LSHNPEIEDVRIKWVEGSRYGPKLIWANCFVHRIEDILAETNLDPKSLILEITESIVLEYTEAMVSQMERLKTLGVRLYLDDFGTGYSSLSYLQRLPLDGLKIDRSFVSQLGSNEQSNAIVEAMIRVTQVLGLRVIGEGVETVEQRAALRAMGCDEVQGYYFSKPMDAAAIVSLIPARAA
jgi:EAL domain-containing protein (putative c-di-GMP-specific phosphodiesterase class I)